MVERVWNLASGMSDTQFLARLAQADTAFGRYLSPVALQAHGLTHPDIRDGKNHEQTWFADTLFITLQARPGLQIRYTTDGSTVTSTSSLYSRPLVLRTSHELRYRAFSGARPVGAEMLQYYELRPLQAKLTGNFTIPPDSLWETTRAWIIGFKDSVRIELTAGRPGTIRYITGENELSNQSPVYTRPLVIKDTTRVKAGLFAGDSLTGQPWTQHFQKE
jgi:hypothetical protein